MTGSLDHSGAARLALFLGGARSGKSMLAERFIRSAAGPFHYIATAEPRDAEMADRIARHRADRGRGWLTEEVPLDLAGAVAALPAGASALVDCATLWLSNHLLAGSDLGLESDHLVAALHRSRAARIAIVSNEVGWGIVPDNALSRAFRDAQGRLNQRLAAECGLVVGVMAGLPFALKGHLPEGLSDHHR
jgi:adenosylcobinamide kinase/adenosylcobinamide-phosphate guanylyltransferase